MLFHQSNEITAAWAHASAAALDAAPHPAVTDYVKALAREYANGRVVFTELALDLADSVLAMAAHHENWKYAQLLELVWLVPGVARELPMLGRIGPEVAAHFEPADVFELGSRLGRLLHHGGAYSSSDRPTAPSHTAGVATAEALMDSTSAAFVANTAWCGFFLDVAWDHTLVVVSPARRRLQLLLATDTD